MVKLILVYYMCLKYLLVIILASSFLGILFETVYDGNAFVLMEGFSAEEI